MDWLTSPRITGVISAIAFFILVTIPMPAAGAVLSKGAKDNIGIGEKLKLIRQLSNGTGVQLSKEAGSLVNQEEKCLLGFGILGCLDAVWSFLSDEEMDLLKLIWELDEKLGIPIIATPQKDVCYTKGCLEAAHDILEAMDTSADACKDYYQYACGRWVKNNPVPPTTTRWNRIDVLRKEVNEFTQKLLSKEQNVADARPINQAKQFYKDCIDVKAREAKGVEPLLKIISAFGGWPLLDLTKWKEDEFDLVKAAAEIRRLTLDSALIFAYVYPDAKNTLRNVVYLSQPSLGLSWSILNAPKEYPEVMKAYEGYIMGVAKQLGTVLNDVDLLARVKSLIAFDVELANGKLKGSEEAYYNPYTLSKYQSETDAIEPGFTIPWKKFLDLLFINSGVTIADDEDIIVRDLYYYEREIPILKKTPKSTLADYVVWRLLANLVSETTEAMRDTVFNFKKVQTGATKPKTIQVTCADSALSAFGMAISVKYVEAKFPKDAKVEVNKIVKNVIASFKEMINNEEWMEEETKKKAIEKADAIRPFTAYPDWLDKESTVEAYYKGLELAGSHFQNQININIYEKDKELKTLRVPTDRNEWIDDPTTVNAFYSEIQNSITLLAALLQRPFFGKGRPKYINYGSTGFITGHENTHGFDSFGSQFGKGGNLENWWGAKTLEAFVTKTKCMIEQYSAVFLDRANTYVNGWLTLDENVADNGGIREAYLAYQKNVQDNGPEKKLPGLEDHSQNQLFFIGYANMWCESVTDEGLKNQILTDPHSPAEIRVEMVLRNTKEFAQAFNCPEDEDGMNPPKEQKCEVW